MKRTLVLLALVSPLFFARSAGAHPPPFWWMTDMSGTSRGGVELTVGNPAIGVADADAIAGSVFIEAAINRTLSVHGRLPLTFVFFDPAVSGEESEGALGNLSFGIQGTARSRGGGGSRTLYGGGITLYVPTASDDGAAPLAAGATRQLYLPDPGRWLVDTTTLRFRGDLRVESGSFFFQSELDIDAHFRDGDDDLDLVLGLGPGVAVTHSLAFLVEVAVAEITDEEQFTLDAGLRYHTPALMLGFRVYLPLSDPLRDADVFGIGFDVGARF